VGSVFAAAAALAEGGGRQGSTVATASKEGPQALPAREKSGPDDRDRPLVLGLR